MAIVETTAPWLDGREWSCTDCGWQYRITANQMASAKYGLAPQPPTECEVCAKNKRPLEHALLAEPITALRVWKVERRETVTLDRALLARMSETWAAGGNPFEGLVGTRLAAVAANRTWEREELASCTHLRAGLIWTTIPERPKLAHQAPDRNCGCGVWAVKTEEMLWAALRGYGGAGHQMAYGKVQMWGRFYEHKLGYRAQYARPLEVTVIDGSDDVCRELSDFYGCEVKSGPLPEAARQTPWQEGVLMPRTSGLQQFISTNSSNVIRSPTSTPKPWTPTPNPSQVGLEQVPKEREKRRRRKRK